MAASETSQCRAAERIVSGFFKEAGFKVVRYGYEHNMRRLKSRDRLLTGACADYLRQQPDLVVINKQNMAFFVEVKHDKNTVLPDNIYRYPWCYVVYLSPEGIMAQSTYYLYKKERDFEQINQIPAFKGISPTLYSKYARKLRRTLGDERLLGQMVEGLAEKLVGRPFIAPPSRPPMSVLVREPPKPKRRKR